MFCFSKPHPLLPESLTNSRIKTRGSATPGRITGTPFQHEKSNDTNHNSETFHSRQALSAEQTLSSTLQIIWCLFAGSNTTTQRELQQQQKLQSADTILRRQTGVFKSNNYFKKYYLPCQATERKKPQSFHGLPFLFAALSKLCPKTQFQLCQSELARCVQTPTLPLRRLRRNPCPKPTRSGPQIFPAKTPINEKYLNTKVSPRREQFLFKATEGSMRTLFRAEVV